MPKNIPNKNHSQNNLFTVAEVTHNDEDQVAVPQNQLESCGHSKGGCRNGCSCYSEWQGCDDESYSETSDSSQAPVFKI